MSLKPKPEVEDLKIGTHGGINHAELGAAGIAPEDVLDFSVCSNPFMPPPGVMKALDNISINQYPDSESTELVQKLSGKLGIPIDHILLGSGTMELIRLIALTYFRPGDPVLIIEPTFGEYEITCRIVGARPVRQWAGVEDSFTPNVETTIALIRQHHPTGIFICNPGNPGGRYLSQEMVETVFDAVEDGLLILDEAYVSFVGRSWPSLELLSRGNVVILRSMTKDFGLAGLRLGYALARQEIIHYLRKVRPPWNVNVVAQKIGAACLDKSEYLQRSLEKISDAKQFLFDELSRLGFPVVPSDAHYFLVKVGDAQAFRTVLLKHGILVRDCTSFGLPEYVRISPRTTPECQKLIDTMAALKGNKEILT